jgi:hypothetical protein
MAAVSRAGPATSSDPPGRVFTDDELSEIFQIDFGQIFGNPEAGLKSSYKGIQSKKPARRSSSRAGIGVVSAVCSTKLSCAPQHPGYTPQQQTTYITAAC